MIANEIRARVGRARAYALLLGLALACQADDPSPLEVCQADPAAACCGDDECGDGSICDFDYLCSPAPGGGVQCSDPSGDRRCHPRCDAAAEGQACPGEAGVCARLERFQGGDSGQELWACLPP